MKKINVIYAFFDLLREYGLTVEDLVKAMDEENIDVYNELINRLSVKSRDIVSYIYSIPWKKACILLFIIQAFYIVNIPGQYKGYLLDPPRDAVMEASRVKPSGLLYLLRYLNQLI